MRDQLTALLQALEGELRRQGRWDQRPPPQAALESDQPFAVDTLSFDQWLQWILLPRLGDLLRRQLPLPANCAMGPMAEEVYVEDGDRGLRIIAILVEIDALLTSGQGGLN